MDTLSPELKKALMNLPGGFNEYKEQAKARFDSLENKIDEAVYVNLPNGQGNRMKVANILPKMHLEIKEIRESTEVLRDFQKLHNIMKKYKLYHFFIIILLTVLGLGARDIVVDVLKGFIK